MYACSVVGIRRLLVRPRSIVVFVAVVVHVHGVPFMVVVLYGRAMLVMYSG